MNENCYDLNYLKKYENNPFIYERKTIDNEISYSYDNIFNETKKCMKYFQELQVKPCVGIALDLKEHSAETCILLLGILNYGCHFYCLDFEDVKDNDVYLKASGVEYVITYRNLKHENLAKVLSSDIAILKGVFLLYLLQNDNNLQNYKLCYTIATSGSTGQPKMVHVPYECIKANIKSLSQLMNIQENDIIFLNSPATFDPFVVEFFLALENGASIIITSKELRLQPQQLLKILFPEQKTSKLGVTVYQTTPSLLRIFGQENIRHVILKKESSLRCLILGGEEFLSHVEFKSWLPLEFFSCGKRIFNIYGITEVSCWSSIKEFDNKTFEKSRVPPLGTPLDNFTFFRIIDDFSNVLLHNECRGELEIGSCVRRCFIPQIDHDIKILKGRDIIYRQTGDFVKRDSSGNIYYIGRLNNSFKRYGKRFCLDSLNKKIESRLNEYQIDLKVISLWHMETSKLIFCFFNNEEYVDHKKQFVVKILKETLEPNEQPDQIIYDKEVPLNSHGKVDRKKILQRLSLTTKITALKVFQDFLTNVMGFKLELGVNEFSTTNPTNKRLKLSTNLSFLQAGGTSFQALSLATEIAEHIETNSKQRKILELFLDNSVTIQDILVFLNSCPPRINTIKESQIFSNENVENIDLNLKQLWRCDLTKCIDATPSIFEGKYVSVGSHSHILLTVNALNGEEISRFKLNDRIESPVVFITSQLAMVGCYDGFLYGFDYIKGTILWQLDAKGMIKAKPLVVKNTILISSYGEDCNILAFDIETLSLKWKVKLGSKGISSSPVQITEDSVLFCCLDGTYALLEAQTGTIQWQQKLDTPIFSTATKVQIRNNIFLGLAEVKGQISICKAENGKTITKFQAEGNIFSGLTLLPCDDKNSSMILFGCHDKNFYCLKLDYNNKQLSMLSKYKLNAAVYSTPVVIFKNYVLACSTKGLIVILDLVETKLLASIDIKAEIFSTPKCLNDKYIYVGSRDNYLYCFQIENK